MTFMFWLTKLVRQLDAAFLALLLCVYVLAALVPPPAWLTTPMPGVRTAQILLATLLFIAGMRTPVPHDLRDVLGRSFLIGCGVAGRLIPLGVLIGCIAGAVPGTEPSLMRDIVVGLTMVAAMPAANTATAWTRRSCGDLTICAGVIVATTMLAPLVIPVTVAFIGGKAGADSLPGSTFEEMAVAVIAWVIVPIVVGVVLGRLGRCATDKPLGPLASLGSLGVLLFLNYLNASQALPSLLERGGLEALAWSACGAVALVPLSYAVGAYGARLSAATAPQGVALVYTVGMSNTGLASTLAVEDFLGRPATLYPIVLCTLLQHVAAAIVHDRERRVAAISPASVPDAAEPEPQETSRAGRPDAPRR